MNQVSRIAAIALACLAWETAPVQAANVPDGVAVVPVTMREVDKAYLMPGADFRPYRKILLAKADVALQKDWLRSVNNNRASLASRVTEEDARTVVADARAGLDEAWLQAFRSAGYEVVSSPGEGVLQVTPSVVDLYVNSPESAGSGTLRSFTREAGEGTLNVDLRDSRSGTLLGRLTDRRQTTRTRRPQLTDGVTNRAEFDQLFATWARVAVNGLKDLEANSPLPGNLQPGQKLAPR